MADMTTPKPFLDELYEKISSVIGGTNENQYLCLTLPGTIINSKDFEYNDTDENVEKSAHVKANEGKCFCPLTGTPTFTF